ncbi:uncharacterized protein LOC131658071 [Vicia villosa]|uniref:uncharacterized protein LOC131658071 n=1 Tax=Vicia villosa TaxID=3911 RepID=UPI00273C2A7F|nr:uncharacterized protein LOC131658071 [Vicia villosa]
MGFYEQLIGTEKQNRRHVDITILRKGPQLNRTQQDSLTQHVTEKEVWDALKGMGDNKAPGTDGFNAKIFKTDFFINKRLYKAANCALVTLIPKSKDASAMREMRPIACCSTIYKIISRILTARLSKVIHTTVHDSQTAFMAGRNIHDNIILTHELIRGYNRKHISPRCTIQIDLQKAYDTVNWDALETTLRTVSYRYLINGQVSGILKAKRGLRQGGPVSPLLFVIVMEYLHRCMVELEYNKEFKYHPRGDVNSVQVMMQAFNRFYEETGLIANPEKFKVFFGGTCLEDQQAIRETTGFVEGKLPIRYLGVPLASRKFYAGRQQLVQSVLMAISGYWVNVFPIPKKIIKRIRTLCKNLLWSAKVGGRKALVAWDNVREPKNTGGLNFKKVYTQNNIAWERANQMGKFNTSSMYKAICGDSVEVPWKCLFFQNRASPRTNFILWLTLLGRLSTKDRLVRFGLIQDTNCCFCQQRETLQHLFFVCEFSSKIWEDVLQWNGYKRTATTWDKEKLCLIKETAMKGWRREILRIIIAETIYHIWYERNEVVFKHTRPSMNIPRRIKDRVMNRSLLYRKLIPHVSISNDSLI